MKFTKEMVMRIIKEEISKHTNESMGEPEQFSDVPELSFEDSNRFVEAYNIIGKAVESGTLPESVEDAVFDMLGKLGIPLQEQQHEKTI